MRDREALESLVGHPLAGGEWPTGALRPGARVRVVQDKRWGGPWREVFEAAIDDTIAPRPVPHSAARPGEMEYSIVFDAPQQDFDGNGPYRKAVIWDRYLEAL